MSFKDDVVPVVCFFCLFFGFFFFLVKVFERQVDNWNANEIDHGKVLILMPLHLLNIPN